VFTLFPNLPPELRIKIWHFSLPGPRIIEVKPLADGPFSERAFHFNGAHPPPVLGACRESRGIALSVYKPLFETDILRNRTLGNKLKELPLVYIDPAHDTIYVSTPDYPFRSTADPRTLIYPEFALKYPDIARVQSVAVDFGNSEDISHDISTILTAVIRWSSKSLKEIVLVSAFYSNRSRNSKESEILFVEPDGEAQAKNKARDIAAAFCPDIRVRVMSIKTLWALTRPSSGGIELDDYDSDDMFD
jgi:hypothetical protein